MLDKYELIKEVGNKPVQKPDNQKFNGKSVHKKTSWLFGFLVSLLAIISPLVVILAYKTQAFCDALINMICGCDLLILCISTLIVIQQDYELKDKLVNLINIYILVVAFFYSGLSILNEMDLINNIGVAVFVNVLALVVFFFIIIASWIIRVKGDRR